MSNWPDTICQFGDSHCTVSTGLFYESFRWQKEEEKQLTFSFFLSNELFMEDMWGLIKRNYLCTKIDVQALSSSWCCSVVNTAAEVSIAPTESNITINHHLLQQKYLQTTNVLMYYKESKSFNLKLQL